MEGTRNMFGARAAAQYLGISYSTVKYHVQQGNLIGQLVNNRTRVFTREELDDFDSHQDGKPMAKDETRYQTERAAIHSAMNDDSQPEVARKARALYLMYEKDYTRNAAAEAVGVSYQAIHNWHQAFMKAGVAGLAVQKRGRKVGGR